jgi:hypothetical protein
LDEPVNERLRTVMLERGKTPVDIATACRVDPKTVDRWISPGRVPHRKHRWAIVELLKTDEAHLWPDETRTQRQPEEPESELVRVYPDRASVPRELWLRHLGGAERTVDVLVFSGTFFAQTNPRVARMIADRAAAGTRIRLCFGDPAGAAVGTRDREERLHGNLAAKIRASLTYYRDLVGVDNCEVRLHDTTLYASIFRFDDQMIANPHIWGQPASANPVLHLRRAEASGWFDRYAESFDAVWNTAHPWIPTEMAAYQHG